MTLLNDLARLKEHHVWMSEKVATELMAAGHFLAQQGAVKYDEYLTELCNVDTDRLKLSAEQTYG